MHLLPVMFVKMLGTTSRNFNSIELGKDLGIYVILKKVEIFFLKKETLLKDLLKICMSCKIIPSGAQPINQTLDSHIPSESAGSSCVASEASL